MTDRSSSPTRSHSALSIAMPAVVRTRLSNGIELHIIETGTQPVWRLDVMFGAGSYNQPAGGVASLCNLLLKEGTLSYSSQEIAQRLDYYGAWLQNSVTQHHSYLTLFSLRKHTHEVLPILYEIAFSPVFPAEEREIVKQRQANQCEIQREKVQYLAQQAMREALYGKQHPYGKATLKKDILAVSHQEIEAFHQHYYTSDNCRLVVSGQITDELLACIEDTFGQISSHRIKNKPAPLIERSTQHIQRVEKPHSVQSGINMAIPIITRGEQEYPYLRVVNTLLGGYFGSRLMSSIREEKGYTYHISSAMVSQPLGAYLTISTQTATAHTSLLIEAVFAEIDRLQNTRVSEEELSKVKGYYEGEAARLLDGQFAIVESYLSLLANDLPIDYYTHLVDCCHATTADMIRDLAQRHLKKDLFYTIVAGEKVPDTNFPI